MAENIEEHLIQLEKEKILRIEESDILAEDSHTSLEHTEKQDLYRENQQNHHTDEKEVGIKHGSSS